MYPDLGSMEQALKAEGVQYLREINELTDREARPWMAHPTFTGDIALAGGGPDFPRSYAVSAMQ